jgi:hypothetical protein
MVGKDGKMSRDKDFGSFAEPGEVNSNPVSVMVDLLGLGEDFSREVVIHSFLQCATNPSLNDILILGQTQASIRATKPETIGESHLHIMLLGVLGHVVAVEVLWGITRLVQVESRRHYALR